MNAVDLLGLRFTWTLPLFACLLGIVTFVLCFALTLSSIDNIAVHGIALPYVSETGDRGAQKFVFAIGLTLCAVCYAGVAVFNAAMFRELHVESTHAKRASLVSQGFGCVGALFLCLLATFDTLKYPSIHLYCAILFFVCNTIYVTLFAAAHLTYARETSPWRNTTSSRVRLAFIIIYWVAFIVYMPIGLSISFASDDCYVVKPSGDYDYSACASIHIVRIISQYFAIIFSLLLVGALAFDLRRWRNEHLQIKPSQSA